MLETEIHVLSIDGGGAAGLMEAIALRDIMQLSSVIYRNPGVLIPLLEGDPDFVLSSSKEPIIHKMNMLEDHETIHPTEVFTYIGGTSTGALQAYALVGGNSETTGISRKRMPMPVKQVMNFYIKAIPIIFCCPVNNGVLDGVVKSLCNSTGLPYPYKIGALQGELRKVFGNTYTDEIEHQGCYERAVTRRFNEDRSRADSLEIFDAKTNPERKAADVLMASANAPGYFDYPVYIGEQAYVDGGIGGNNPTTMILNRVKQIMPDRRIGTVLSLAPPLSASISKIDELDGVVNKQYKAPLYVLQENTNGDVIYNAEKKFNKDIFFQRVRPTSAISRDVKLDEKNTTKMTDIMEFELRQNPEYFGKIFDGAAVIAWRKKGTKSRQHIKLFEAALVSMVSRKNYDSVLYLAREMERWLLRQDGSFNHTRAFVDYILGKVYHETSRLKAALSYYQKTLSYQEGTALAAVSYGDLLLELGNSTEALSWFNRYSLNIQLWSMKSDLHSNDNYDHSFLSSQIFFRIGKCHRRLGNYSASLLFLNHSSLMLRQYANDQASMKLEAEIRLHKAMALLDLEQTDEAEELLQINLNLPDTMMPNDRFREMNSLVMFAVTFARNNHAEADEYARDVKSGAQKYVDDDFLIMDSFDSYVAVFFNAFNQEHFEEASEYILELNSMLSSFNLRKVKDPDDILLEMAVVTLIRCGNCQKAIQYYRKKSEEFGYEPNRPKALEFIAACHVKAEDYGAGEQTLEKAEQLLIAHRDVKKMSEEEFKDLTKLRIFRYSIKAFSAKGQCPAVDNNGTTTVMSPWIKQMDFVELQTNQDMVKENYGFETDSWISDKVLLISVPLSAFIIYTVSVFLIGYNVSRILRNGLGFFRKFYSKKFSAVECCVLVWYIFTKLTYPVEYKTVLSVLIVLKCSLMNRAFREYL